MRNSSLNTTSYCGTINDIITLIKSVNKFSSYLTAGFPVQS